MGFSYILDKYIQYEYNGIGNIVSAKTVSSTGSTSTKSFTYSDNANPDRLTSYDGKAITYDAIGCPTSYDGKTFTWTNGKLTKLAFGTLSAGRNTYNYVYNALGQRTEKSFAYINTSRIQSPGDFGESQVVYTTSKNTKYYYDHSGRLIAEYCVENLSDFTQTSTRLEYLYNGNKMVGFVYTASGVNMGAYYFQHNLQGDVVAIYDTNGAEVARYTYDAWGNCSIAASTTDYAVALANPIRYRGYYFDQESGWYFLNARYYSPEWCRFISPDDTDYLAPKNVNGLNLYCYCNNDPVNFVDPSGHFLITLGIIGFFATAVAVVALVSVVATCILIETVKVVVQGVKCAANAFGNLLNDPFQPIKDNSTKENIEDVWKDVWEDVGEDVLEDINEEVLNSSHYKNLYETFGGPGEDLMYAMYEEYGIEWK